MMPQWPPTVPRWVARPPGPPRVRRVVAPRPYAGPPRNRLGPPRWGFPPVVWVPQRPLSAPVPEAPRLGVAMALSVLAAVGAGLAAAAEGWRYALMLRGRTEVLPAAVVDRSDDLVVAGGLVALLTAGVAILAVVGVLGALTAFGAARAGVRPPRDDASRLLKLLVPGYNLHGAGQVLVETDLLLRTDPEEPGPRRPSRVVIVWWWAWLLNGLGLIALLVRTRMPGTQAAADSVLLHLVVDLAAVVVAALTVAVLAGFRRAVRPARVPDIAGWVPTIPV